MEQTFNYNPYSPYENTNFDPNLSDLYKEPMFNPMLQYEQSYLYYRSLCMQLDYKIKCKEYENLCSNTTPKSERKSEQTRI